MNSISFDVFGFFVTALIIWCLITSRIELWVAIIFLLSKFNFKVKIKWPTKSIK
jgi:hypothetical protein